MLTRKTIVSFFWILILSLTGCASNKKEQSLSAMYPDKQVRVYEVFGMDCPGCHGGIEKLVKEIPKVLDAKANWSEKKITIILEKGAKVENSIIFEAIKRSNFTSGKRLQ